MHSLTDFSKEPLLLSREGDYLDPLYLLAFLLSRCCRSPEFIDGCQSRRRPEITELTAGSQELGNLTSVALQSSPFPRQLAEWGRALTYMQRKCSPYHAAVFSCGKVNIPYDYELSCRASTAQRRTK